MYTPIYRKSAYCFKHKEGQSTEEPRKAFLIKDKKVISTKKKENKKALNVYSLVPKKTLFGNGIFCWIQILHTSDIEDS